MELPACPRCSGRLMKGLVFDCGGPNHVITCFNCELEAPTLEELMVKAELPKVRVASIAHSG